MNYQVIVFGGAGYNTLGVLRSFKKKSITPFLLIIKSVQLKATISSKAVKDFKIVNTAEEGVQFLLEGYNVYGNNTPVIIPTSDKAESALDNAYRLLSGKYIFPNAQEEGRVTYLMNKQLMTRIAEKHGIYVPKTFCISSEKSIPDAIPYPCFVKPLKSIAGSKGDIKICHTKEELISVIAASNGRSYLVQQYIRKDFDILLNGCRQISNGRVIFQGIFKKYRWSENGGDGSWGIITSNISEYINQKDIESFMSELNYYGPFSIEFGVKDDIPYFFEINLRNDGTSHYFNLLNDHISYLWYLDAINHQVFDLSSKGVIEYTFIDELGDFINIFTTNLTLKQWLWDMKDAKIYKYFDKKDKLPFFRMLPRRILKVIYLIIFKRI